MNKSLILGVSISLLILLTSSFAIAAVQSPQVSSESNDKSIDLALQSYTGDVTSNEFSAMCYENERTLVAGRIYDATTNKSVPKADVTVQCIHNNKTVTAKTKSNKLGIYSVTFKHNQCDEKDMVTVTAVGKDGSSGSETGVITEGHGIFKKFDIAIVNVPLVPEFGLTLGIVTILGALVAFFVIRRK